MASGKALQSRIGKLIKRLNVTHRTVKLRDVSTSGGNSLLGLGGTVSTTDTVVDPQPTVSLADAQTIANSGGLYQLGDYEMLFAGTIPEATLKNRLVVYGDEVLRIVNIDPVVFGGVVVVWKVMTRTAKAGT